MVKREIDARLVERFANEHVALLIYVASPELRQELRVRGQVLPYARSEPRVRGHE